MMGKMVWVLAFALVAMDVCADALKDGFVAPPASARPHVYWQWMNGNVTKEGITADLEEMARAGIGGAMIFDVVGGLPAGSVAFGSEAWFDLLHHAHEEARRFGLELSIMDCSGWSSSGGPWVKPEDSMKHVVHTETIVRGGASFKGVLPVPENTHGFYRDLAVLAFPRPAAESIDPMDYGMGSLFKPGDREATILFEKPFPLSGITVDFDVRVRHADAVLKVDVSRDGETFQTVVDGFAVYPTRYGDREESVFVPVDAGLVRAVKVTCDFDVVTQMPGRVEDGVVSMKPQDGEVTQPGRRRLVGVRPEARGRIPEFNAKVFNLRSRIVGYPYAAKPDQVVDSGRIVDLTARLSSDGAIEWTAPEGDDWIIARFGCASNGRGPRAATKCGGGLEVDKLSKEALGRFFAGYVDKVLARIGPVSPDRGLNGVLVDSYEVGCQNWTDGFGRQFKTRKGYDIIPYLPILTGRVVSSPQETERVLGDLRSVISDLFAENYAAEFQRLCHARGLKFLREPYGSMPGDDLRQARRCDMPMGEFWFGDAAAPTLAGRLGSKDNSRFPGFISHIWGQRFAGAEAFTSGMKDDRWTRAPVDYKAQGDRAFCRGVNKLVYHCWVHQPWTTPANYPGMTMGPYGAHFSRTQTWWEDAAPALLKCQSRCQWMLQEGRTAADVLVFAGDSPTNYGLDLSRWHDYGMVADNAFGEGRQWDVCGGEALVASRAENGEIVVPSGARYKVVGVLPRILIDAESQAALDRLSAQGVRIVASDQVDTTLKEMGIAPDFECLTPSCAEEVRWIHREMDEDSDVYFVALPNDDAVSMEVAFRDAGRVPEIWDPESGRISRPAFRRQGKDRTVVRLDLPPAGSAFVVFRPTPTDGLVSADDVTAERMTVVPVEGAWAVEFQDGRGAPAGSVMFDELTPWNEHTDACIRYYSGSAVYRMSVPDPRTGNERLRLDLGDVKNVATVAVNGRTYPVLWKPPFRVDITDAPSRHDRLDLEIKVTNLWPNRLIGDEALPCDAAYSKIGNIVAIPPRVFDGKPSPTGRHTFVTWRLWTGDDALLPSGLIGPVRLMVEAAERAAPATGVGAARGADGAATLMGHTFANGWTLDYLAVFWIGVVALSVAFTIAAGRCGRNRCGGKG